jgi:hypothetical protein
MQMNPTHAPSHEQPEMRRVDLQTSPNSPQTFVVWVGMRRQSTQPPQSLDKKGRVRASPFEENA